MKLTILVAVGVVTVLFLFRVRGVLTPFFLAATVSYLGYPIVRRLEERKVPRTWAILIMYAMFTVVILFLVFAILPGLMKEMEQIATSLPRQGHRIESFFQSTFGKYQRAQIPDAVKDLIDATVLRLEGIIGSVARKTADIIVGLFASVFHFVLAPFLAFYILRDLDVLADAIVSWMPNEWRKHAVQLARRVDHVVGGYVRSQLIVSAVIGILVTVGLWALGVRYALFLGLITGLADIIPYFGPIVSAVPALLLALFESPITALWVLVLLVAVQQFEGAILQPKIVGDQVGLHPLSVIFAVLVGNELGGIFGMLISVPLAAAIKVIATYVGDMTLEL